MNKLFIGILSAVLSVGIVLAFSQMDDVKELEDELGSIYSDQIRNSKFLLADISRVDWKQAELSENELNLYISNLSNSFFPTHNVSPTMNLISEEINQIKNWMETLRDEGALTVEEQEALSNNAYHLYLMMEDLYVEIQDNRQLYRGIYEEDEMMEKIIQENMENLIRVE